MRSAFVSLKKRDPSFEGILPLLLLQSKLHPHRRRGMSLTLQLGH